MSEKSYAITFVRVDRKHQQRLLTE